MHSSDLYEVFTRLSGPEKRAISKFLASPFFNQRQEVIDLWDYFLKHASSGRPAFQKEKVFKHLFLGQAYNDARIRHVMSWLLKSIEQYLAYAEYKTIPINETLHLAQVYNDKKLEKLSQKAIKVADKQLAKMNRGQDFFNYNFLLEYKKYDLAQNQRSSKANNLGKMATALDKHILLSKLKQACILRTHQNVVKTDYDFSLTELLLKFLETSDYMKEPGIAAYYNCYLALNNDDEAAFQMLKKSIQKKQNLFSADDLKMLYFFCINFCIRKLNTGNAIYTREVFELFRFGLQQDVLIIDGELSPFTYNNIASAGLKLKEFHWLDDFIEVYRTKLPPRHRESYHTYNLARLYFHQRKYSDAMGLLHKVDERDLLLNLDAKVMLLKLYYELHEYDALSSLLTSFNVMLTRKKVLGYHKTHYSNIIKFTNRLLGLKPRDQKARDKLKLDIQNAAVLQEKEWLLAQLALVR